MPFAPDPFFRGPAMLEGAIIGAAIGLTAGLVMWLIRKLKGDTDTKDRDDR
jgi:hypothetical protein